MCSILFVLYIYLPSLHGHDVKMSKRVYTSYDEIFFLKWIWLSGIQPMRRVRQHLTKWVSWNNRDEDWNNSNSPFYATFSLPSLSADFKVSIKINFYGKERFFTKAINLSLWLEIFKRINNRRGTRKTFMSRAKRRFLFFHSVSRLRGQGRTISIELKDKSIALGHLICIIRKLN